MTPLASPPEEVDRNGLFWRGLGLTLFVELLISGLAFLVMKRRREPPAKSPATANATTSIISPDLEQSDGGAERTSGTPASGKGRAGRYKPLAIGLLVVFLSNLITYPVVWFCFPLLGEALVQSYERSLGFVILISALFYALMLILIFNAKTTIWKILWVLVSIIGTPVLVVFYIILALASGYGLPILYTGSMPAWAVILAAESFAVIAETLLLRVLCRGVGVRITWVQAFITSLSMNAGSYLAGLFLLGPFTL